MPARPIRQVTVPLYTGRQIALPVSSNELLEALLRDHSSARQLIAQIRKNGASTLYPQLADALRRHSKAEEQTLYSQLMAVGRAMNRTGDGAGEAIMAQIRLSTQHHQALASLLRRLDSTPVAHPVWSSRFEQAVRALENHLATEESSVFDTAREQIPVPIRIELGRRYEALMQALAPRVTNPATIRPRVTNPVARPVARGHRERPGAPVSYRNAVAGELAPRRAANPKPDLAKILGDAIVHGRLDLSPILEKPSRS